MDIVPPAVRRLIVAAALAAAAACSAPAEPGSPAPLANTFESQEALARAVLAALAARDAERLGALPLSEAEFREQVWPELPASRPERNVPFDYAWGQSKQNSDAFLSTTLSRYGGRRLIFVGARFAGDTTTYASFSVMRDSEIIAADEEGRELILRLYGSVLVRDGRFKMFSYVVDD